MHNFQSVLLPKARFFNQEHISRFTAEESRSRCAIYPWPVWAVNCPYLFHVWMCVCNRPAINEGNIVCSFGIYFQSGFLPLTKPICTITIGRGWYNYAVKTTTNTLPPLTPVRVRFLFYQKSRTKFTVFQLKTVKLLLLLAAWSSSRSTRTRASAALSPPS